MASSSESRPSYTVVARRYRPQGFDQLIGQAHVVTALGNAIRQNRVGHAYLFTGARGVGKTSAARIFAKSLNCQQGPTPTPCNHCEICQMVSTGEDIDVLEIDGASNRGIDEIRELRSNAGVRPSRARYKIYIIDEVHMLTREAFNALLKTLEEPPGHVKFIFCTTDPQKIPITVLSRCQRFDFVPVETGNIAARLAEIAAAEGIDAEPAALQLLARRAGGSMRDSQSLLEQLLSFCDGTLTVANVNSLLGTADLSTITAIVEGVAAASPGQAISAIHSAISSGADPGRFAQQLVVYVRDLLAIHTGCDAGLLLQVTESDFPRAKELADELGLERLIAILQVLDNAVVRMQSSPHARVLLEAAAARAATIGQTLSINKLIASLGRASGIASNPTVSESPGSAAGKKKELSDDSRNLTATTNIPDAAGKISHYAGSPSYSPAPVVTDIAPNEVPVGGFAATETGNSIGHPVSGSANAVEVWKRTLATLSRAGDMIADMASQYSRVESGGDLMTVTLKREYEYQLCNDPQRKKRLETAVSNAAGIATRLEFRFDEATRIPAPQAVQRLSRAQQMRILEQHPLVRKVSEMFDGEIVDFNYVDKSNPGPP